MPISFDCHIWNKLCAVYDCLNCHLATVALQTIKLFIMTNKQIIKSSTIIVLGFFQVCPVFLLSSSTIIGAVLGLFWLVLLLYIWSSTRIGKWYFRELWRATLRLENFLFGNITDC